jgi:dihydrofolate reductase
VQFLLLITHDDTFVPTAELVDGIHAWDAEMDARGLRRAGRPLRPPAEAVTVRVREGARVVTAGPATAGVEQTAAYELLECDSLADALEAAAAHPMAAAGAIEVRPVWEELADDAAKDRRAQAEPTDADTPRGKVVWSATVSLDGFIAGPDDAMGWVFDLSGPDPWVDEIKRTTGAVLAGRRSYDVGRRGERPEVEEAFGGGWSGAQFVLTHRPHDPDPGNTFLSGDIRDAVTLGLAAAEGKDLMIIGADVARQCLASGLIDEVVVFIAPVLLGDGVRLVARLDDAPVELQLVGSGQAGQIAHLRFAIARG